MLLQLIQFMSIVATLVVESSNLVVIFFNTVVSVATVYQKAVSLGELRKLNYSTPYGRILLQSCYTLLLKARSLTYQSINILIYFSQILFWNFFYILCTYMVRNVNSLLFLVIPDNR